MRVFITVLVLIFSLQSWTKADDISDFQIEGMSIGDSALEFFSEEEIKKNSGDYYKNKTFTPFEVYKKPFFKVYEFVGGAFKAEDNNYIFHHIKGVIEYPNDIKSCYKKMNEVVDQLTDFFENVKKTNKETIDHSYDKSGKSKITFVSSCFSSFLCDALERDGENAGLY